MKTITIVADDRVGLLADISYILSKAKINIESIGVDVVSGKALIRLSLNNVDKGKSVLAAAGYGVEEENAVVVKLNDQPGELNRITALLSKEGVVIQTIHMLSKDGKNTVLSITVDKPKKAATLLTDILLSKDDGSSMG